MNDAADADSILHQLPISGSTPTDAHQAMNALLARVLLEVARRRHEVLPGLTESLQDRMLLTTGGTTRHVHGWFQPDAWQKDDRPVHELFINAEFSGHDPWISPAEDVLVTLLHEACHLFAEVNEIKDTSRNGRYHNRRFAEIALQIGLQTERDQQIGHRTPRLSARGLYEYTDLLAELEAGLILSRRSPATEHDEGIDAESEQPNGINTETPSVASSKYVFAKCCCRRGRGSVTIRIARGSWRPGVVRCAACGEAFAESLTTNGQAGQTRTSEEPVTSTLRGDDA